jgi:beta-lactamase class A
VRDMVAARIWVRSAFMKASALQSKIAGLIWSQSYSIGDAFYKARGASDVGTRCLRALCRGSL